MLQEREAVHLGHHQVQQHQPGKGAPRLLQRDQPVRRHVHLPAVLLEGGAQHTARIGIVLGDQYGVRIAQAAILRQQRK